MPRIKGACPGVHSQYMEPIYATPQLIPHLYSDRDSFKGPAGPRWCRQAASIRGAATRHRGGACWAQRSIFPRGSLGGTFPLTLQSPASPGPPFLPITQLHPQAILAQAQLSGLVHLGHRPAESQPWLQSWPFPIIV